MNQVTIRKHVGLIHIGNREKSGIQIFEKLKQNDFKLNQWDIIEYQESLNGILAIDVFVVNIGDADFDYDVLLDDLFEKDIPVIINEAILTSQYTGIQRQRWERHLLNKIDPSISILPLNYNNKIEKNKLIDLSNIGIKKTWVLAASIGGPEAIQSFIEEFDLNNDYLFIVVQHIDKEFIPMLTQQLNKASKIHIDTPISGMKINVPSCIVHPTDEYIELNKKGILELLPINDVYSFTPCIDEVCKKLAINIKNLNIAVFSGMSTDGVQAAKLIKESGGKVITQLESSCVVSSIISGVKEQVQINYQGTPKEMAQYIKDN